jgi:hypothetical protein
MHRQIDAEFKETLLTQPEAQKVFGFSQGAADIS